VGGEGLHKNVRGEGLGRGQVGVVKRVVWGGEYVGREGGCGGGEGVWTIGGESGTGGEGEMGRGVVGWG